MAPIVPSQQELDRRKFVEFTSERVKDGANTEYPHFYPGEDHRWDVDKFRQKFRVQIHEASDPHDVTFSLIGLDASIANAFRRVLIAEVPTLAMENIFVTQNTSIIHDEILAQRLGLIPLKGNTEGIRFLRWFRKATDEKPGSEMTDYNTVVLELDVTCDWKPGMKARYVGGGPDADRLTARDLYEHAEVYASDLVYVPAGRQHQFFTGAGAVAPVNPGVVLAKLRPGQSIRLTAHCVKGIGADHAKFSPVATASYRLLPEIRITRPIVGADAKKFARCFPKGVIGLEPVTRDEAAEKGGGYEGREGELKAVVRDPMRDTVSRECLRHDEFKDKVKLGRIRDHFIFKIESTGQFESEELFVESVRLLRAKCDRMKRALAVMMGG